MRKTKAIIFFGIIMLLILILIPIFIVIDNCISFGSVEGTISMISLSHTESNNTRQSFNGNTSLSVVFYEIEENKVAEIPANSTISDSGFAYSKEFNLYYGVTNGKQGEATDISLLGIQKSQENSSKVVEINRLLISEDFPVFNPLIDNDGGVYYTRKPVEGDSLELIYRSNSLYIAKQVTTCFGTMFGVGEKGICFDIMETGVRSVVFMNHLGDSFTVLDNAYICGRSCDGNIVLIKNYLGELFQYDCSTELLIKLLDNQSLLESLMTCTISPDGRFIAGCFQSNNNNQCSVKIINLNTKRYKNIYESSLIGSISWK